MAAIEEKSPIYLAPHLIPSYIGLWETHILEYNSLTKLQLSQCQGSLVKQDFGIGFAALHAAKNSNSFGMVMHNEGRMLAG